MYRNLSHTCTQAGLSSQDGSTSHAIASGNDECMPHLPFVCKRITGSKHRPDVCLLQQCVVSIQLCDTLLTEIDVQDAQLTYILLILAKQE